MPGTVTSVSVCATTREVSGCELISCIASSSESAGLASRLQRLDPLLPWSFVFFPLAVWGLARTLRGTRRHFQLLPLWVIATSTLGTLVYWGALRLRVPIEPLVTLYAAAGVADIAWRVRMRRAGLTLVSSQRG